MGIIKDLLLIGGGVAAAVWYKDVKQSRDSIKTTQKTARETVMEGLAGSALLAVEAQAKAKKNGERVIDESELPEAVRKNRNKNKKNQ